MTMQPLNTSNSPTSTMGSLLQAAHNLGALNLPGTGALNLDPNELVTRSVVNGLRAAVRELTDPERIQAREDEAKKRDEAEKAKVQAEKEEVARRLREAERALLTGGSSASALAITRRDAAQLQELANSMQVPPEVRQQIAVALAFIQGVVEQQERRVEQASARREDRDDDSVRPGSERRREGPISDLLQTAVERVVSIGTRQG